MGTYQSTRLSNMSSSRIEVLRAEIRADETLLAQTHLRQSARIAALHDLLASREPGEDDLDGRPHPGWDREILMADLRLGRGQATERVNTALDLRDRLPQTAAQLSAGAISWQHAVALSHGITLLSDAQALLVENKVLHDPRAHTSWEFREMARKMAIGLQPAETLPTAREVHQNRSLDVFLIDGIEGALSGRFTAEDLVTITAAINERAKPASDYDPRTIAQLRADALVEMCADDLAGELGLGSTGPEVAEDALDGAAEHAVDSAAGSRCESGSARRAREANPVRVVVEVPFDTLVNAGTFRPVERAATVRTDAPNDGLCAEPAPIDPGTLARLSCDADVWRLVTDPPTGQPLDYGRISHNPPARLRAAVLARDRHACTFPGCRARRRLEVHHLRHWARGGPTRPDNLCALCPRHHKAVHDAGWCAAFDDTGALHWTGPGGVRAPAHPSDLTGILRADVPEPASDPVPAGGERWQPWRLTTRRVRLAASAPAHHDESDADPPPF